MNSREQLHETLVNMLGSRNVYFQPPEGQTLKYPCIIYEFNSPDTRNADNKKYIVVKKYHVKHIYKKLSDSLEGSFFDVFMMVSHDNRMIADSMYNDDYTLYY